MLVTADTSDVFEITSLEFWSTPMNQECESTNRIIHVVRGLVEIVGRQILVVLALSNDLCRSILLPEHLPECDTRVIRCNDVPDHPARDIAGLSLEVSEGLKEAEP